MPPTYPRILLVSSSVFNPYSGGGAMLTNLFRGWPADKIAIVHNDPIPPDTAVCRKFYELGPREFQWSPPFSILQPYFRSHSPDGPGQVPNNTTPTIKKFVKSRVKALLGEEMPTMAHLSRELVRWVKTFNPQGIYTILGNLPYIRLTEKLASLLKVPVAVHMMDDWPTTIYRKGIFGPCLRISMQKEFKKLLNSAALRMGIAENMCKEYESRYGYRFLPFQNTIDASEWLKDARKNQSTHTPFRIVYAGTIMSESQLDSLADVCDAVAGLHRSGMKIEMDIHSLYADKYRSRLERHPGVRLHLPTGHDIFASILRNADLLVIPVNFDRKSVRYVKYSMPAKIPAYMISGTPILVYGPAEVSSIQYALTGKWGYVISQKSQSALKEAIRLLATDMNLRTELATRAKKTALRNHDSAKIRPAFQEALIKACSTHPDYAYETSGG